jgi:hypothetical protein
LRTARVGVKMLFEFPSLLPLLSSPVAHFFSSRHSFLYNGGVTWEYRYYPDVLQCSFEQNRHPHESP